MDASTLKLIILPSGLIAVLFALYLARDVLRRDAGVRRAVAARWRCLFLDEFQDTDPLQAEILLLLAANDPAERDWRKARPAPGKLDRKSVV